MQEVTLGQRLFHIELLFYVNSAEASGGDTLVDPLWYHILP
jgi:hypothetical protein